MNYKRKFWWFRVLVTVDTTWSLGSLQFQLEGGCRLYVYLEGCLPGESGTDAASRRAPPHLHIALSFAQLARVREPGGRVDPLAEAGADAARSQYISGTAAKQQQGLFKGVRNTLQKLFHFQEVKRSKRSEVRAKKPSLKQPGDQRLKGILSTTTNGRAGGLLVRTGSLSGHPSKQQLRSTLLHLVILR
ncbi:hypothetical protein J6590_102676 [Homalodisca vitripennis]|nr:hypothetical protein J6590_102676 [Homalodisca vitripennis]